MFQLGSNDALSQNFMKLGLLVAENNLDTQTHRQTRFMFYKYRYVYRSKQSKIRDRMTII